MRCLPPALRGVLVEADASIRPQSQNLKIDAAQSLDRAVVARGTPSLRSPARALEQKPSTGRDVDVVEQVPAACRRDNRRDDPGGVPRNSSRLIGRQA